jgi:hypothetical protein
VVNGWGDSAMMRFFRKPMLLMEKLSRRREVELVGEKKQETNSQPQSTSKPEGTFVHKLDAAGLRALLGEDFPVDILVWRSVSVRFLRAMIKPWLLGRFWLWLLYGLEELFPRYFGEKGQYPLITFSKK